MPQWQVLHVRREVSIIGLRSNDSTGVQRQLIESHTVDCTYSTLRAIVIIGGTSRVCQQFSLLTSNQMMFLHVRLI